MGETYLYLMAMGQITAFISNTPFLNCTTYSLFTHVPNSNRKVRHVSERERERRETERETERDRERETERETRERQRERDRERRTQHTRHVDTRP